MSEKSNCSKSIRTQLLEEMREGIYADCERLPRESVLSEKMGISRTQLRDILSALEREGFITRRHGVGTVINHHVLNVCSRTDIETEFLEIIQQNGHQPGTAYADWGEETADKEAAGKLQIPEGSSVLWIKRLCTADGKPAIYCKDVLDKNLIKKEYSGWSAEHTVFDFLQEFCGISAYMDLTEIHAVTADETLAEIFGIPVGAPLLNLKEVDFDIEGKPVFYSNQYFMDTFFQQIVLRKKL